MVAGNIGVVAGAGVVVVAPPAPPAPPAPAPASESDGTVVAAAKAAADAVVPVAAENVNVNVFLLNTNSILTHCTILSRLVTLERCLGCIQHPINLHRFHFQQSYLLLDGCCLRGGAGGVRRGHRGVADGYDLVAHGPSGGKLYN